MCAYLECLKSQKINTIMRILTMHPLWIKAIQILDTMLKLYWVIRIDFFLQSVSGWMKMNILVRITVGTIVPVWDSLISGNWEV